MNSTLHTSVTPRTVKVLVVDDQLSNLNFMRAVFRAKGHLVLEAQNADAALEILRQENIELLVTDVHMPRMSGIDLVKKARELNAQLRAVIVTGGGIGAAERREFEELGVGSLAKPFTPSQLSACIEAALGGGKGSSGV